MGEVLVYGSYGYSGDRITRAALEADIEPVVAGRNGEKVRSQARKLGVDHAVFGLDERQVIESALADIDVVLHCAGPFVHTFEPMVEACLATGTHYLDITGEISVFQALAARDQEARDADVMVLPGTAFDVVPTDCMAAFLEERLSSAASLQLAFDVMNLWNIAGGTLATGIENCHRDDAGVLVGNTVIRQNGRLVVKPPAWKSRRIDFGNGLKQALTIPWGDLVTAYHTTDAPNIEFYAALNWPERAIIKSFRYFGPLYEFDAIRQTMSSLVQRYKSGPSEEFHEDDQSAIWGRARDDDSTTVEARLQCPAGYEVIAQAPVVILQRVLAGDAPPGYQTPAGAYGPDLVLDIDGVERELVQG